MSKCLLPFKKGTSTRLLPFRSQRMDTSKPVYIDHGGPNVGEFGRTTN